MDPTAPFILHFSSDFDQNIDTNHVQKNLIIDCAHRENQRNEVYIQGDSGEICNTLGNDSMCDSKKKSSYEHGSDFERLPRYGKKKIGPSCEHEQQLRNK